MKLRWSDTSTHEVEFDAETLDMFRAYAPLMLDKLFDRTQRDWANLHIADPMATPTRWWQARAIGGIYAERGADITPHLNGYWAELVRMYDHLLRLSRLAGQITDDAFRRMGEQ